LALKSSHKVAQRLRAALPKVDLTDAELARLLADVEVVPELKRVPKTLRQIADSISTPSRQLLPLLSHLAVLQVVKRGFNARCPNCETHAWHPLHNLNETLTCPGCFSTFLLPVEYPSGSELAWEYT